MISGKHSDDVRYDERLKEIFNIKDFVAALNYSPTS